MEFSDGLQVVLMALLCFSTDLISQMHLVCLLEATQSASIDVEIKQD